MIGCVNWALANESQTLQNNATNISTSSCDIILQPTCNLTATEINNGTEQHQNGVGSQLLTIFGDIGNQYIHYLLVQYMEPCLCY